MPETPPLGLDIRHEWLLDDGRLTVNHGSYGATPRPVLAAQDAWRERMEREPTRFMRRVLPEALRRSAERLAAFVGADGADLVFVDNATAGCNAVLRSLRFKLGDEILLLDQTYAAVRNAARFVSERSGATVMEAVLPFPRPDADAVVAAVAAGLTPRTKLAILDHVCSPSGLVLPIRDLVAACRERGVPALVDGAHGPGQVDVDLGALGADWYVGNCHKWLMAPKGCGFLWARRERQADLHPVTISHGYGKGFLPEFDWTGTRDPSACLSVEVAIAFHDRLGGPALRARNAALAREGAEILADRLGTEVGAGPEFWGSMAAVQLPLDGPATPERARALSGVFQDRFGTDAPLQALAGAIWLRLSAQAYNVREDYERLAGMAAAWVAEVRG